MRTFRIIYFATICLPPPLALILYPLVFLRYVRFPMVLIEYHAFYFWLGLALLLFDLWRSSLSTDQKIIWSVLNVALGVVCLPVYWYRYILRAERVSIEPRR